MGGKQCEVPTITCKPRDALLAAVSAAAKSVLVQGYGEVAGTEDAKVIEERLRVLIVRDFTNVEVSNFETSGDGAPLEGDIPSMPEHIFPVLENAILPMTVLVAVGSFVALATGHRSVGDLTHARLAKARRLE